MKTGSKIITKCQICGKSFTRAGVVGHMRFKHGKDYKNPSLDVERPIPITEARAKARAYDGLFDQALEIVSPCCRALLISARQIPTTDEKTGVEFFKCEKCGKLYKAVIKIGFYIGGPDSSSPVRTDEKGRWLCEQGGLIKWGELFVA